MELQDYMISINPKSDILIYGKEYHCWCNGRYPGVYKWVKDSFIGDSFQQHFGNTVNVCVPTYFELIIKNK